MNKPVIYVIGSLRNPNIPHVGLELETLNVEAFTDWHEAGPAADDYWKAGQLIKGNTYKQALKDWTSQHVFDFDKKHLDRCNAAVLVLPAGRSCHLELGYIIGQGKPGYILLTPEDDPEYRWDQMYNFATGLASSIEELKDLIKGTLSV